MFENIGSKIKTVAVTLTWLGIVMSVLTGLVIFLDGSMEGLFIMIFGSLFSWLGSFLLYGFGQLVENSDKLVDLLVPSDPVGESSVTPRYSADFRPLTGAAAPTYHPSIEDTLYPPAEPADWVCFSCGNSNFHRVNTCQRCGVTKHWSDTKHAEASSTIRFK